MKWPLIIAIIWYWWRVYLLSFNPDQFPDRAYAHRIWDRRANRSFFLGAAILTALSCMRWVSFTRGGPLRSRLLLALLLSCLFRYLS